MPIYCVYLTVYLGNKLPMFYIGKSTTEKIEKGYRGSVSSKQYKNIWKSELKNSPHLFKIFILKTFETKFESSEYEIFIQRKFNVHKNPMYINMNIGGVSFNLDEAIQNKTHHFFSSDFQKWVNNKRVAEGTSKFLDSDFQREMSLRGHAKRTHDEKSKVATKSNRDRVSAGTHNFLNNGSAISDLSKQRTSRDSVKFLRLLSTRYKIKIGKGWTRRSDDWVDNTIREIIASKPNFFIG